jgi:uncharacterized damage-inducible protein DinB
MRMLDKILAVWEHAFWADRAFLEVLRQNQEAVPGAVREYAHVIGAGEVWLSRLEGRPPRTAVWPSLSFTEVERLLEESQAGWTAYLSRLDDTALESTVSYRNTAGREFRTGVADILLHAVLHSHYHRGKVNLMFQKAGVTPVSVDYIAFVREEPAAAKSVPSSTETS